MERGHIAKVVAGSRGSSMKTNPIVLSDEEIRSILVERL
jgi:alcohol dehydrogenase